MTPQEAIEFIKCTAAYRYGRIYKDESDIILALNMAAKALETVSEMQKRNITSETVLEYAKFEDECVEKGFSFTSLLEAREKQIPKKPLPDQKYYGHGKCPSCRAVFMDKSTIYCGNCGQHIDWEGG